MLRKLFVLTLLVSLAFSEPCVRYTFEDDFYEIFSNFGICDMYTFWKVGTYDNIDVEAPHERSRSFITPSESFSCVSSFMFPMTGNGIFEMLVYMETDDRTEQITVVATEYVPNGIDTNRGTAGIYAIGADYEDGWHMISMNVTGLGTAMCYISIMGMTSPNSTVLVDSFRYIPPGMDESECQLYENLPEAKNPRFNSFRS